VDPTDTPLRVGVSSCLLGEAVRYDGGHKRDRLLIDTLGPLVEWVPVCPELEAGLGVPRPAMHLVRRAGEPRLLEIDSGHDHTEALSRLSAERVGELAGLQLAGYVLKARSPSCGVTGERGLFAAALIDAVPGLPVEEEGRLQDASVLEAFLERMRAYRQAPG
jgi:uncharacterized protein YbbK (DUF523 family)